MSNQARCPECGRFFLARTENDSLLIAPRICGNPNCGFGTEESDFH